MGGGFGSVGNHLVEVELVQVRAGLGLVHVGGGGGGVTVQRGQRGKHWRE